MMGSIRIWLATATLALGCKLGAVTRVSMTSQPLAVSCFAQVVIADGTLTLGRSPYATGIPSASVGDPSVAWILSESDLPAGFPSPKPSPGGVFLQGLAPGQTTISIDADFSDGSKRHATSTVRVRSIEAVNIAPVCDDKVDLPLRTPTGTSYTFDAVFLGGGQELAGYCPGSLMGDNVTCKPSHIDALTDSTQCQWAAPADGGSTRVSSPLQSGFSAQLETYGPADVTAIGADISSGVMNVQTAGLGGGSFTAHVNLAGGRPCRSLAIQATTLSPGLCAGPAGETAWTQPYSGDAMHSDQTVHYTSLAEGDCQLALGAAGAASYPTIVDLPIRVATDFTAAHTAEPNNPCPSEGATACLSNFLAVETCKGRSWNSPSPCPQGRACEVLPAGTSGCTASTGCARCR